jgi:uncharacterized RDD family membrane protein YckC
MLDFHAATEVIYAGFWRRFAGLFLDGLVLGTVSAVFGLLFGSQSTLAVVLSLLTGVAYQVYFVTGTGQTLGSTVVGIRVVGVDGNPLSVGAALARIVGAYVSGALLGIGYLWMLWDGNQQMLHDKMAGSIIVRLEPREWPPGSVEGRDGRGPRLNPGIAPHTSRRTAGVRSSHSPREGGSGRRSGGQETGGERGPNGYREPSFHSR